MFAPYFASLLNTVTANVLHETILRNTKILSKQVYTTGISIWILLVEAFDEINNIQDSKSFMKSGDGLFKQRIRTQTMKWLHVKKTGADLFAGFTKVTTDFLKKM